MIYEQCYVEAPLNQKTSERAGFNWVLNKKNCAVTCKYKSFSLFAFRIKEIYFVLPHWTALVRERQLNQKVSQRKIPLRNLLSWHGLKYMCYWLQLFRDVIRDVEPRFSFIGVVMFQTGESVILNSFVITQFLLQAGRSLLKAKKRPLMQWKAYM